MDDPQATAYASEIVRQKAKKNPCGLCEQIDCEGCEYFEKKQTEAKARYD